MSPAMAAAAAVTGKLKDVRALTGHVSSNASTATSSELDGKDFTQELTLPSPEAATTTTAATNGSAPDAAGGMPKFVKLEGVVAAPLRKANVDTDCIIPKQFLKTIKRTGLGTAAFFELRYEDDGVTEKPDFVLNQEYYRTSNILVAMENFGCGSSREHAPWSINDFGIRCIIAPSFADIFFNNCFKNGMLPIKLPKEKVEELMVDAEAKKKLTIDLPAQSIIREGGETMSFDVDQFRKHCLINGLDDIGITLTKVAVIDKFEASRRELYPWLEPAPGGKDSAEVRVSTSKGSNFYARTARGFLNGLPATADRPERPPASEVVFSATGAAIERAVRAVLELQASGDAVIESTRTGLVHAPGGSGTANVPQVVIRMRPAPRGQALQPVSVQGNDGCDCKDTKKTDW